MDSKVKPTINERIIKLGEPHLVSYWTEFLEATEEQIEAAMGKVGPRLEDVRAALGKRRLP